MGPLTMRFALLLPQGRPSVYGSGNTLLQRFRQRDQGPVVLDRTLDKLARAGTAQNRQDGFLPFAQTRLGLYSIGIDQLVTVQTDMVIADRGQIIDPRNAVKVQQILCRDKRVIMACHTAQDRPIHGNPMLG